MTGPLNMLRALLRRGWRAEAGTATVEFVLVFPMIMMVFFSTFEGATYATRKAMLERALDITVRGLRLGDFVNPTNDTLKASICSLTAGVIPDCLNVVMLQLQPVSTTTWALPDPGATCVNRKENIQPVTTIQQGTSDEMMIVRACAIVDPVFPNTGVGLSMTKAAGGGYAVVATSAFVNEPS